MATRSNIAIILRPEDRNRTFNVMDDEFDDYCPVMKCPNCRSEKTEDWKDIFPDCEPNGSPVLQIYCHWDGYPEGVGEALQSGYNTYEQALALILGGDLSSLDTSCSYPYSLGKGEDASRCAPTVLSEPELNEEYLYVFDYKTNQWFVQYAYGEDENKLTPLADVLQ